MAVSPLEEVTYFSAYNSLIHQKEMLEDTVRMDAFHDAILENAENFAGKVVLDVGCGTGVLALFAANAGARKVYAVEATRAANLARKLVAANKKEDVVTVIHSKVEEVELPEKVDVIVSEWMGESHVLGAHKSVSDRLCARLADQCSLSLSLCLSFCGRARARVTHHPPGHFLLRESMIDSVIFARDKFLKPDGAMYPSHAKMYMAPAFSRTHFENLEMETQEVTDKWNGILVSIREEYGVDLDALTQVHARELEEQKLGTSEPVHLEPRELLGPRVCVKEINMLSVTPEEVKFVRHNFEFDLLVPKRLRPGQGEREPCLFNMFVGWFVVDFNGSPSNPSLFHVECGTGPYHGTTHWGQEGFFVHPPIEVTRFDKMEMSFSMTRKPELWRLYDVNVEFSAHSASTSQRLPKMSKNYNFE